jgi:hypothetical protein
MSDPRPCERKCEECGDYKHHSRFHSWKRSNSTVATFSAKCRDCEQKARNEKKNADRPRSIIEQRAASAATKWGVSKRFFITQMNYRALIPELRALMTDEGLCKGCGHEFLNERDIQIEHIEPPRQEIVPDWARLHARNLRLCCGSCNRTKGSKPFSQWLDEQEGARLSNLQQPSVEPAAASTSPMQLTLGFGS